MKKISKSKNKLEYIAVFTKEKDNRYSVSFPDLPGCVTFGNNLKHAQKMAKEVLELWLEYLLSKEIKQKKITKKNIIRKITVNIRCK